MDRTRALVVSTDREFRDRISAALAALVSIVLEAESVDEARRLTSSTAPQLVVLGRVSPEPAAIDWISSARRDGQSWPVVLVAPTSTLAAGLESVRPDTLLVEAALTDRARALLTGAAAATPAEESLDFDAAFAALRADYVKTLPADVEQLNQAVATSLASPADAGAIGLARQLAHRLAGTSASYGLDDFGAAAAAVESYFVQRSKGIAPTDEASARLQAGMETLRSFVA